MVFSLQTNIHSLKAQNFHARALNVQERSFERVSSGVRINRASDDAASLALATNLSSEITAYNNNIRQANEALSMLQVAEEALNESDNMLIQMYQLAIQASNGSTNDRQRANLNSTYQQLLTQVGNIVTQTQYNENNLLDGSLNNMTIQVDSGSDQSVNALSISIEDIRQWTSTPQTASVFSPVKAITQVGVDIDGEAANDTSGLLSLSADGSIVAIGARLNDGGGGNSGHVRLYQYDGTTWNQLGSDIDGEAAGDESGISVSLSADGSIVAIGARYNDGNGSNSGHVRLYQYDGTTWNRLGDDINGEAAGDQSGWSVSLSADGSIVAIGARFNDGNGSNSGHVRLYKYDGTAWNQLGSDIDGEAAGDVSGLSVSLSADGSIVAIGGRSNDGNGGNSGHVRLYQYDGTTWNQLGQDIDGEAAGDQSGSSVSLSADGSIVAIGAIKNDANGSNSGHVRLYQYDGTTWNQLGQDIDGEAAGDELGSSVSLSADGSIVAIDAIKNDANGSNSGHVRLYQYDGNTWNQLGDDIDGEAAADSSGKTVSLSADGSIVAIGAQYNDGNGNNSGHVRLYQIPVTNTFLNTDITSLANAQQNVLTLREAIDNISTTRASIGATYNRFQSALNALNSKITNTEAALARVQDSDIARESSLITKSQIIQNASISMMMQARLLPSNILDLLQ